MDRKALKEHKQWLYTEYLIGRFFGITENDLRNPDFLVFPSGKTLRWR